MNLFYDYLPFEIQHKILISSLVNQMSDKIKGRRHNVSNPTFACYFGGAPGLKVARSIINDILFNNNMNLYWNIVLDSVNHLQFMNNQILFMKYMSENDIINICLANNITNIMSMSKDTLIRSLMKI